MLTDSGMKLEVAEIKPCTPGRKSGRKPVKYDKRKCKRRNSIGVMFGWLKDWRQVVIALGQMSHCLLFTFLPRRNHYVLVINPEPRTL